MSDGAMTVLAFALSFALMFGYALRLRMARRRAVPHEPAGAPRAAVSTEVKPRVRERV